MEKILLIGRKDDPHIQGIGNELSKLNEPYFVLDKFTMSDTFCVEFDGKFRSYLKINDKKITNQSIKSIWNTSALRIILEEKIVRDAKEFARAEWTEGISTLWNSIDTKWINHPNSLIKAVNRLKQLDTASKVGLETPKSIVTNDAKELLDFYEQNQRNIIGKTLHSSEGLPENKMIFTNKIEKHDLERANSLKYVPVLFQEYVPKKTELRVTIIEDKFHVAEIHSQMSPKTKDDWRNYDDFKKTPYVKSRLPSEIISKLRKLMKVMDLNFGAVDLIKTPEDKIIFLEINPNGRWWWIQELTGMNISKDIATSLSNVE